MIILHRHPHPRGGGRAEVRRRGPARLQRAPSALLELPPSPPLPSFRAPATAGALLVSWGHDASARAPRPPPARPLGQDAPDRRRLELRAQVGRLPLDRVRRRRRRLPAVAQRPRAAPLLPRADVPRGPLRPRRRDRAVRRPGPPGLRRARPAHPPRRVARRHARRADADALHRVRRARRRRRGAARAAAVRAPRAARGAGRRARRPHADVPPTRTAPRSGCRAPRAWSPSSSARRTGPASASAW